MSVLYILQIAIYESNHLGAIMWQTSNRSYKLYFVTAFRYVKRKEDLFDGTSMFL